MQEIKLSDAQISNSVLLTIQLMSAISSLEEVAIVNTELPEIGQDQCNHALPCM